MEDKSCLYVPLWFIGMGLFILSFIGCSHTNPQALCEEEPFVHTCPQKGHGVCPICYSEEEQIDLSILDHCCVDCELVYEYQIYIAPESNDKKTLVLDQ
jgi:hypothetical protein